MASLLDLAIFLMIGGGAEYLVYRYVASEGKFSVSSAEKNALASKVQVIIESNPNELITIMRQIREQLSQECKYEPISEMLQYTGGMSEDISDKIAHHYGTRLSAESKSRLDANLSDFNHNYSKGIKLESYESIANMFQDLIGDGQEVLDRDTLAKDLGDSAKSLSIGKTSIFYDVLSKYAQRQFTDADIMLYMNALNDIIYRCRTNMAEGPKYYDFLKDISKEIAYASKAIRRRDDLLLFETYEKIFHKAKMRIDIDRTK